MRRTPRQQRSAALVKCILEAADQVQRSLGRERASTNKIAARAGVSIGSLYQYFASKEAIFAALDSAASNEGPNRSSTVTPDRSCLTCC